MSGGIFGCHSWGYGQQLVGGGSPTAHLFQDGPQQGRAGQNPVLLLQSTSWGCPGFSCPPGDWPGDS